jgi:hypothetical protein
MELGIRTVGGGEGRECLGKDLVPSGLNPRAVPRRAPRSVAPGTPTPTSVNRPGSHLHHRP